MPPEASEHKKPLTAISHFLVCARIPQFSHHYEQLLQFIEEYKELLKKQVKESRKKEGLNLLTMHSAKGLEFDVVYIIDAVEGMTPYKKAKTAAETEEERRMFYVAMTRAKNSLFIYVPETLRGKDKEVSRFVKSIKKSVK